MTSCVYAIFFVDHEYLAPAVQEREAGRKTARNGRQNEMNEERQTEKADWEIGKTSRQDKMKEQRDAKATVQEVGKLEMEAETIEETDKKDHVRRGETPETADDHLPAGK